MGSARRGEARKATPDSLAAFQGKASLVQVALALGGDYARGMPEGFPPRLGRWERARFEPTSHLFVRNGRPFETPGDGGSLGDPPPGDGTSGPV